MTSVVIERAEHEGALVDLHIEHGVLIAIVEHSPGARTSNDRTFDAGGGAVIPGLHDHHIHLAACAARVHTVALDDAMAANALRSRLRAASDALPAGHWLRAAGYSEGPDEPLDRASLDAIVGDRPVRVQHRGGALWILNSPAIAAVDAMQSSAPGIERDRNGEPTGRMWGLDRWLREKIPALPLDFAALGTELLRYGITGVTDLTPTEHAADVELLATAHSRGVLPQAVVITGGLRLPAGAAAVLARGPVKIVIADHDLPALDDLADAIGAAHAAGRAVALHSVTRATLILAIAGLDQAGSRSGDRVEHAAVAPRDVIDDLKRLGVTIVTQPGLLHQRGDSYLAGVDAADLVDLWPCARFAAAGIPVAAGSDAPFGPLDPWLAIKTATTRRTAQNEVVNFSERLEARAALDLFLGPAPEPGRPRAVTVGSPADLCILAEPLARVLADPNAEMVVATMCRGELSVWPVR